MKDKIIEKSIELFEKKGFSSTSIQDIVDELGVTKGSFYYYFSSKEQLLMDIHDEYINNLLERQRIILEDQTLTSKEQLIGMIEVSIDDIIENGPRARVYFRELRHLTGENLTKIKEKRKQFRINVETVVKRGMDEGIFKNEIPSDITALGIIGLANWSYNWYKPEGEISPKQLVNIYAQIILKGLLN